MTTASPSYQRTVAIIGCVLSFLTWILAALSVRSVFGDVFADSKAERDRIIAGINFQFRFYLILTAVSFVASAVIAAWSWRRVPMPARITVGVHLVVIAVLLVCTWI